MTEIDGNQSGGQPKKIRRPRRASLYTQAKHLKAAGIAIARFIVEPDGRQIIELVGATDNPSPDSGETIVL
jgi:hypothetical protein